MTNDIDLLAATAYETGIDPITYATVNVIEAHIVAYLVRCEPRRLCDDDLTRVPALSCRIAADLLGAGWTPPVLAEGPES
jgi:hypothetical protein